LNLDVSVPDTTIFEEDLAAKKQPEFFDVLAAADQLLFFMQGYMPLENSRATTCFDAVFGAAALAEQPFS
jgi:hypothetical protein